MFIKNIHVSLCSISLCLENSPWKGCIWKRICQIHQIRWIKYKYKYMVWNLIKYKYKYAVFVFVFVFANTNTYLTPALLLERAAVDRAYTWLTTAMRAFIGHVLGECFEARAFLVMDPQVAFGALDDDLPTPIQHTAHGNLPESCRISSPSPEAMNFVLVMFTWRPLDSNPSFHALTCSTHSSREVAMITRSFAKNSSQGTPTLKSLDKASSTMIISRGLRTEPWWTPTPTSNSSLYSEPTLTRLCALLLFWNMKH